MAWTIRYTAAALKQLSQIDKQTAKRLVNYLDSRVASSEDPHSVGKALTGNRTGQWRYRVGDYRIISRMTLAEIEFSQNRVDVVRLRRFFPGYDVEFDYKFDSDHKLTSLIGSVALPRDWVGESNLYPNADGTVGNIQVKFYRPGTEDRVVRPEDAERYTAELNTVPIYRTVESLPCAGSIPAAEKMNATKK